MTIKLNYENLPPQLLAVITPLRLGLGLLNPEASMGIREQLRSRVARDGKFSKCQALYLPVTPVIPAAWFYDCADCVFYQGQGQACELVEGNIEPSAWCGFWTNLQEDKPFSWVRRALST